MKFQPKSERSAESTKRFRTQVARCHAQLANGTWITIEEVVKLIGSHKASRQCGVGLPVIEENTNNDQFLCMLQVIFYTVERYPENDRRARRELNADVYSSGMLAQSLMNAWKSAVYDRALEHDKNGQECIHALWVKYNSAVLEHRALKAIYAQYSNEAGKERATKIVARMTRGPMTSHPGPTDTLNGTTQQAILDNNGE